MMLKADRLNVLEKLAQLYNGDDFLWVTARPNEGGAASERLKRRRLSWTVTHVVEGGVCDVWSLCPLHLRERLTSFSASLKMSLTSSVSRRPAAFSHMKNVMQMNALYALDLLCGMSLAHNFPSYPNTALSPLCHLLGTVLSSVNVAPLMLNRLS